MGTMKDVAKKCGITVTTVSQMLNGRGYVREKTKMRIRQTMKAAKCPP